MGTDPVFPKQALPLEGADVFSISYSSNHQRARSANALGDQERPSGGELNQDEASGHKRNHTNPQKQQRPAFLRVFVLYGTAPGERYISGRLVSRRPGFGEKLRVRQLVIINELASYGIEWSRIRPYFVSLISYNLNGSLNRKINISYVKNSLRESLGRKAIKLARCAVF